MSRNVGVRVVCHPNLTHFVLLASDITWLKATNQKMFTRAINKGVAAGRLFFLLALRASVPRFANPPVQQATYGNAET